jgi:hypothetical protein
MHWLVISAIILAPILVLRAIPVLHGYNNHINIARLYMLSSQLAFPFKCVRGSKVDCVISNGAPVSVCVFFFIIRTHAPAIGRK